MPALVLLSDGTETRYDLGNRAVVVGRSAECDIHLAEGRASRVHFRVEPTDRGWVVRDLDSSNGTSVNGYAVSRVLLSGGDLVEVGGVTFRFDSDGPGSASRASRPPQERKRPSSGPAWAAALAVALAVAVLTDVLAADTARTRDAQVREAVERAAHAGFLIAGRTADPDEAVKAFEGYLRDHPDGRDAPQARARLQALREAAVVRRAAGEDFDGLAKAAPGLAPAEYRWRFENLVRRWSDSPEALAEVRRRAATLRGPAPPAEDSRILFQRRKREADAAAAAGNYGRALAIWNAHALEAPPASSADWADIRAEVRRIEGDASERAGRILEQAAALRESGRTEEADRLVLEGVLANEGTGAGLRLAARLKAGSAAPGGRPSAAPAPSLPGGEGGYARRRLLLLRATEAEQFVFLRDYRGAAQLYAAIAAEAKDLPDVAEEMRLRSENLAGVGALLEEVRAAPGGWKGKPWPESWDQVAPEELWPHLSKAARKPADRLPLAAFAWDQGLRKQALETLCAALENESTHADAERLYSAREGVPIPEGGFVAERGEVISRGEWKRRRNAEAIVKLRERQAGLVRRLHDTPVVRGVDRVRELRAGLDRARAHALELIFDEVKYFYPYRDRMGEYTPVQMEVDKRVEAVREIWNDRTKFRSKPDSGAVQILKDLDESAAKLRELGAEPGGPEREVDAVRRYFDRDLDIRTFFLDGGELEQFEYNAGVLRENAKKRTVAEEGEVRQVEITNEYRIMFGRRALLLQDRLVLSARAHGDDMSRGGFFSHFNERLLNMKPGEKVPKQACGCSSDGLVPGCSHGPDARIRAQGYDFIACSENIHAGSGDPEDAHRGWCHSSGHHRNILHTGWTEMGTGRVGKFWTQNFGLPPGVDAPQDGAGSTPWDRAGGRGTGEDGNPPGGR